MTQEPKYEFRDGYVFNRASGKMIPADEPVMVFRARDKHALPMIGQYLQMIKDPEHILAVAQRLIDFANFKRAHPERMKEPDTDLGREG